MRIVITQASARRRRSSIRRGAQSCRARRACSASAPQTMSSCRQEPGALEAMGRINKQSTKRVKTSSLTQSSRHSHCHCHSQSTLLQSVTCHYCHCHVITCDDEWGRAAGTAPHFNFQDLSPHFRLHPAFYCTLLHAGCQPSACCCRRCWQHRPWSCNPVTKARA